MAVINVTVPDELNVLGNLTQKIVSDFTGGANWMSVLSGALPVLFAEGVRFDEIKAEVKKPEAITLAFVVAGLIVGKLVSDKLAKAAAPAVAQA